MKTRSNDDIFRNIETVEEFVKEAKRWLNDKNYTQKYEAILFDTKTGEPLKYEWKPYRLWDGTLWGDTKWNGAYYHSGDPIEKILKNYNGQVIDNKILITHIGREVDADGVVSAHYQITEVSIKQGDVLTVRGMVLKYLKENRYKGLKRKSCSCSCSVKNPIPCTGIDIQYCSARE